jgi:hypothetical protein
MQGYVIGHPRPIENYAELTTGLGPGERAIAG